MPYPQPEPLSLWQTTADPYLHRKCSNTVLSQSLWGLWVLVCTRFVWALWASLLGMGFDSKREFAPPVILLGLLLWPWTWGISSQLLQCLPSYWVSLTLDMGYLHTTSEALMISLVAQLVKHLLTTWETQVQSLGWEDPLEKEMATLSSTLAWRISWMEEPGGLQSMGLQRVRHDWATSLSFHFLQK